MLVAKHHHETAHPTPSAMSFTSSFASNRFPSHVCLLRRCAPMCASAPRAVKYPSCNHSDCHVGQTFLSLKSVGRCRPVLAKFRLTSPVSSADSDDTDTDQEGAQNRLSPLQLIAANPRGSVNAAAVNRLKKAELQEELNLRSLPEEGTREVLRQRLNQAIKTEQSIPVGKLQP